MTGDTIRAGSQQFLHEAGRPVLEKPLAMERVSEAIEELVRTDPDSAFDPSMQALLQGKEV